MKATELREMTTAELNQELVELKEQLFRLRFQHATNQLDNPMELKTVRRDLARVKTVLREIEITEEKKQEDRV
ncbi:MAG: 50S ribosomal protein L29 [Clostridiaceae bacterium]|jgi:large subunit ribosomal protein L29|nr:50S ribosomal protein L29 [Bacillota bacterium]NLN51782.1 50S ribosomal protein L29 [Clostridiaceae bacterium]